VRFSPPHAWSSFFALPTSQVHRGLPTRLRGFHQIDALEVKAPARIVGPSEHLSQDRRRFPSMCSVLEVSNGTNGQTWSTPTSLILHAYESRRRGHRLRDEAEFQKTPPIHLLGMYFTTQSADAAQEKAPSQWSLPLDAGTRLALSSWL